MILEKHETSELTQLSPNLNGENPNKFFGQYLMGIGKLLYHYNAIVDYITNQRTTVADIKWMCDSFAFLIFKTFPND